MYLSGYLLGELARAHFCASERNFTTCVCSFSQVFTQSILKEAMIKVTTEVNNVNGIVITIIAQNQSLGKYLFV